jgi:hypothetical protein
VEQPFAADLTGRLQAPKRLINCRLLLCSATHFLPFHSSINTTIADCNRVARCIDRLQNSNMAEPQIKPEPDTGSPFMDEADETPDLEFYDRMPGPDADAYNRMYLTRVPNYVWEAWSKLDDDAEIEIGTIRQWTDQTGKPVWQPAAKMAVSCC